MSGLICPGRPQRNTTRQAIFSSPQIVAQSITPTLLQLNPNSTPTLSQPCYYPVTNFPATSHTPPPILSATGSPPATYLKKPRPIFAAALCTGKATPAYRCPHNPLFSLSSLSINPPAARNKFSQNATVLSGTVIFFPDTPTHP
jgi:hypothetical protein